MRFLIFAIVSLLVATPALAAPRVVATVLPVHGLVSAVMQGAGAPELLIPPGRSPHDFALKPSDARALDGADVVVMVGASLEAGISDAIETLAGDASRLVLAEVPGADPLPLDADHDHGHRHGEEGDIDPHLWLDPAVAQLWLDPIAEALSAADPDNASLYRRNAAEAADMLDRLIAETGAALAPVRGKEYVVFHDAWRYFERRFGLEAALSLVPAGGGIPGARGIAGARDHLAAMESPCIFAEPGEDRALVESLAGDGGARIGVLDPLGAGIEPGAEFYPGLVRQAAAALVECLSAPD